MPKYTEAFFNITHKPVTIMQIRNEYNLDHTVYERRYKGHIFCPYCKAVPLTVVHTNGLLYYRGHPHEEHGEGCMYTLKEIVIKDVEKIGGDIEKQAVSQLDMLLRSMVDNNQKPDTTKPGTPDKIVETFLLCIGNKHCKNAFPNAVLNFCQSC